MLESSTNEAGVAPEAAAAGGRAAPEGVIPDSELTGWVFAGRSSVLHRRLRCPRCRSLNRRSRCASTSMAFDATSGDWHGSIAPGSYGVAWCALALELPDPSNASAGVPTHHE